MILKIIKIVSKNYKSNSSKQKFMIRSNYVRHGIYLRKTEATKIKHDVNCRINSLICVTKFYNVDFSKKKFWILGILHT